MNFAFNFFKLLFNVIKGTILSSWYIARIIMQKSTTVRSGITDFHYGELSPNTASLLGALISLTPGTTMVTIDLHQRKLVLHLLDLDQREETLLMIQRDFIVPLRKLRGEQR